jgi:hypothetical protein
MNKNEIRQKAFNSRRTINKNKQDYYTDYQPEYKRLHVEPLVVPIKDKENLEMYIQKDLISKENEKAKEEFNKVLKLFKSGELTEEQFKEASERIKKIKNYRIHSIKNSSQFGNYQESSIPEGQIQQSGDMLEGEAVRHSNLNINDKKIPQGNYQLPHVSDDIGDNHLWSRVKNGKDESILENKVFDEDINYDDVELYSEPPDLPNNRDFSAIKEGEYSLLYDGDIAFTGSEDEVKSLIEDLVRDNNGIEEDRIVVIKRISVSFGCNLNG